MSARVQVLLSTYNGERFLKAQLESLSWQRDVELKILARDDASADKSAEILEGHQGVEVLRGNERLGVVGSFFELCSRADLSCEYFAFSDQDDIWKEDKLRAAVERLRSGSPSRPQLYCSRLAYVNAELRPLGFSQIPPRVGFGNALVENVATGCTVVMNKKLLELMRRENPEKALMHDWWAYLLAAGLGEVVYDAQPRVLYRQHGDNAVGGTASAWQDLSTRARRFRQRGRSAAHVTDQAQDFATRFGAELPDDKRRVLKRFLESKRGFLSRVVFALSPANGVWRQNPLHSFIFRILVLLGRY